VHFRWSSSGLSLIAVKVSRPVANLSPSHRISGNHHGTAAQPLLFDLRCAVQRAASAASQNDASGTRNRNFMADINDSACSGRIDDTGRRSGVSAVVRGAHASYLNWTAGGGVRGVNAL
jgi:hypothetical protein